MESKTESNFLSAKFTNDAVIYRAVGWVAGTYQPSEDDVHQGIFLTEDGLSIPAQLTGQLRGRLKHRHPEYATQPDFFSQFFRWMVYPKTGPLRFELMAMKRLKAEPTTNRLGLDEFCVVGKVKSIDSGRVVVRIQRNQPPRQGGKKASFKVTLTGSLSDEAIGQIWELKVRRIGENLTIVAGQPYQPSPADLVWLEQQQQAAIQSNLSAPIKQQHKSQQQEDTAIAISSKSPAVIPALESLDAPSGLPLASVSASAQTKAQQQQVLPKLAKTPAQQQQVLPKPAKMPAQQQQILPKPAKMPAQQQQILPKPAKMPAQQHDKPAAQKKQLSPEMTNSTAPQQKPVFQVKVNDRVFNGYDSVTLNRRIVCVDGKAIAQTKMAIVVGQPKTMQADGGVTQGNNQAVLLSK